jgi:hypothetical protein
LYYCMRNALTGLMGGWAGPNPCLLGLKNKGNTMFPSLRRDICVI